MGFLSAISMAHRWIAERVQIGDTVIDATAGGGVDTLTLAKLVGKKGHVLAFDIQQEALVKTKQRLESYEQAGSLPAVQLIQDSHAHLLQYAKPETVQAVMFNLGYFPGGDESIITVPDSTIPALDQALSVVKKGGIITCMLYPGHPGGDHEAKLVEQWAAALSTDRAQSIIYRQLQRNHAPYLIGIIKK